MTDETKKCPACAETVQAAAQVCRFCRYNFMTGEPPPPPPPKSGNKTLIIVLVGCACLLLAVPVISIIAAIAIPSLLTAQRSSNERNAAASLKTLTTAEADFRSNDRDRNGRDDFWTGDVRQLCTFQIDDGSQLMLIESSIADADASPLQPGGNRSPKASYWFAAIETDERERPYNAKDGRHPDKFGFCAYPSKYPSGGRLTFIVDESCTLWKKDTGGVRVLSWPARPGDEGWMRVD